MPDSNPPPQFIVSWHDAGREPICPADPAFPNGVDADLSGGAAKTCRAELPYPARRCGSYLIRCRTCGFQAILTTAGRTDDPRSVVLPCRGGER